jgi:predicted PurR-regulated permease PerM
MPELQHFNPLTKAVLLAFALVLFGLLFHELVTLLVAILITVLIAIPLSSTASGLERFGIPRVIGALIGLLIGLGIFAGLLYLVIPPFVDQAEELVDQIPGVIDTLQEKIDDIGGADAGSEVQEFFQQYTDDPGQLVGPLTSIGLGLAGVLGAILLILITAYYIAVRPQPLVDGAVSLFPPERREWAREVMERLRATWIGWMHGVLVDMVITGVLLYIGLQLIGLDYAIFFAVFSALLVLIPYFGAILGAIPPTLFALTDSPEKAVLALAIYVIVQQVESNLTIPLVMANRVQLHPAVVAIGVILIGQLFGFIGLFVAVPILSLIVVLVDELWRKPIERDRALRPATALEALDTEGGVVSAEREPTGTGLGSARGGGSPTP